MRRDASEFYWGAWVDKGCFDMEEQNSGEFVDLYVYMIADVLQDTTLVQRYVYARTSAIPLIMHTSPIRPLIKGVL